MTDTEEILKISRGFPAEPYTIQNYLTSWRRT